MNRFSILFLPVLVTIVAGSYREGVSCRKRRRDDGSWFFGCGSADRLIPANSSNQLPHIYREVSCPPVKRNDGSIFFDCVGAIPKTDLRIKMILKPEPEPQPSKPLRIRPVSTTIQTTIKSRSRVRKVLRRKKMKIITTEPPLVIATLTSMTTVTPDSLVTTYAPSQRLRFKKRPVSGSENIRQLSRRVTGENSKIAKPLSSRRIPETIAHPVEGTELKPTAQRRRKLKRRTTETPEYTNILEGLQNIEILKL